MRVVELWDRAEGFQDFVQNMLTPASTALGIEHFFTLDPARLQGLCPAALGEVAREFGKTAQLTRGIAQRCDGGAGKEACTIGTQPPSLAVTQSNNATFSVVASGTAVTTRSIPAKPRNAWLS